jgi:hypothetical protein
MFKAWLQERGQQESADAVHLQVAMRQLYKRAPSSWQQSFQVAALLKRGCTAEESAMRPFAEEASALLQNFPQPQAGAWCSTSATNTAGISCNCKEH